MKKYIFYFLHVHNTLIYFWFDVFIMNVAICTKVGLKETNATFASFALGTWYHVPNTAISNITGSLSFFLFDFDFSLTQTTFCGFLIFLVKKGKWVKLYVWIHTIARSKEHGPTSSEWYLDIFNSTYFDVFMNFVDQKVFKKFHLIRIILGTESYPGTRY